ncbi:MAG: UDP-N-acetylmuramate dehydrogenase [Thermotogae bacterium]|nr:UDP-N-acetylmuramate dehydrogenase [Thermotogota bacterium]
MSEIINENIIKALYTGGCEIKKNEPLKNHTYFRIGGYTPCMIMPRTKQAFINAIKVLTENQITYRTLGGGANLIVRDGNLDFAVIATKYLTEIKIAENKIYAEAGIPITRLSLIACENSLSGLEFASGIPGTLGGALFMNAGAYDDEMKNVVESVEVINTKTLEIKKITNTEMNFGYRKSILQSSDFIALSAEIKLQIKNKKEIEEKMKELLTKRWEKQPIEYPSAGSTFKRPKPDFYVGTTIEKLGLKGYSQGDAQISEKHAGFVINRGNATYEEIIKLTDFVKEKIKKEYGENVELEPEIW